MYKCNDCKKIFQKPKTEIDTLGVDNQSGIIEYDYCPFCESSSIHKLYCNNCGKEIENIFELYQDDKKNICLKCFESEN